jgi:hypothetical protein
MMSTAETPQSIHATQMADTERQTAGGKVLWHYDVRWTWREPRDGLDDRNLVALALSRSTPRRRAPC